MTTKRKVNKLKVILLCGGKGERLNPITNIIPKPLIPIKGIPILSYLVSYLEIYDFKDIIIATGYKSKKIYEYFDKNHKNLNIEIVDSGDVDIIKRIQDASSLISGDFIMCYGDTLADINFSEMIEYHHEHNGILTITSYPLHSPFGILDIGESGNVISFKEKPVLDKWINIGYLYFSKECLPYIKNNISFVDFLHERVKKKEMFSYKHRGIHITVNTITELRDAENNIASFKKILNR
jgi:glucose-1-phosphate cytidylyltransferase